MGRQKGNQDCYAFYSITNVSQSYNGIGGNGNSDRSRSGSGTGSRISNTDGNHVGQNPGPSCKFIVKDTILSPSTSGTTREFKTFNDLGNDQRTDRSFSSSSLSLPNNDMESDKSGYNSGKFQDVSNNNNSNNNNNNNNNNNSSSNSKNNSSSSSVLDVCRWIPTYTGEAFGLRHSVRCNGRGGTYSPILS